VREAPIIVETAPNPVAACIWLHGLGADGMDFVPLVDQLQVKWPVRFVLPHAPVRPVTINGGMPMRAWFDIAHPDLGAQVDVKGIETSAAWVAELAQAQQLPVLLAGFSQGGLVALHAALSHGVTQQVVALSTWYPLSVPVNRLQVFMAHGTADTMVPLSMAEASCAALRQAGASVAWHTYPMSHSVCAEEVADLRQWFNRQLEGLHG